MDEKQKTSRKCGRCNKVRVHNLGFDVCDRCAKREEMRAREHARKLRDPEGYKAKVARRVARYKARRKLDGKPDKTKVPPKKQPKPPISPLPRAPVQEFHLDETAAPLKSTEKRFLTVEEATRAEMARRELARRKLIHFILRRHPRYKAGWVHAEICEKLDKFRQDVADGLSPRLMIFMPPRHGKALISIEKILTPDGWKHHGALKAGDRVFGLDGKPIEILAETPSVLCDCEVEFTDGSTIRCHENHEWTVYDRSYAKWRTVETKWLMSSNRGERQLFSGGRAVFQLPERAPLEMERKELPVAPYVLGAWLGDGTSGQGTICYAASDDATTIAVGQDYVVSNTWVHKTTGVVYSYFAKLVPDLRKIGVLNNKHIPTIYKLSSIDQRLQLLAGLIDTDGHVERKTQRVRIATVSDQLAEDIEDIVRSLGWRASRYTQAPTLSTSGIQGTRPVHYVSFTPDRPIPTHIERKKIVGRKKSQRRIGIKAVRRCEAGRGKCIQVDSPDGLYLVGRELIPTHNSMICSEEYPAFHLGHHPEHQIIASSFSESLCLDFSRKVQETVAGEDFELLFPECKLRPNATSFEVWQTTAGGKYVAAGVGGPLLGRGAHVLLIDDPFKNKEEAESPAHRNKIKNWYKSTAYTRLMPGGGVLIIQQRWHDDDLSGWLLTEMKAAEDEMKQTGEWPVDADRWEVVRYPAIAVTDEKYRRKGEALHPDRYPLSALLKIKRTAQSEWNALYQQDPVPETGEYFTKDMIRYYEGAAPAGLSKITACDLAISKEDHANYSVLLTVGVDEHDDIYVLDARRSRWDSMEIVDELIDVQRTWVPQLIGIEKTHVEQAIGPFLEKRIREERLFSMVIEPLTPGKRDKMLRAQPIRGRMKQGKVLFPKGAAFLEWLIPELLRFPASAQDDGVDALAWIGQMMNMVQYTAVPKPKTTSWKDKLSTVVASIAKVGRNPSMGA